MAAVTFKDETATGRPLAEVRLDGLPERMTVRELIRLRAEPSLFVANYAGWGAGQLESEMSQNAWLNVQADASIIFDVPAEDRYPAAMRLLGIDPLMLAGEAGHA